MPKDQYYNEINAIVSKYAPSKKNSARDTQNTFQIELEAQKAQEQLERLQFEIEENKRKEEEHIKLQAKVKEQRKKRRINQKK